MADGRLIAPLEAGRGEQVPDVWTSRDVRILVAVPCWSWEIVLRIPKGRTEPGWALTRPILRLVAAGLGTQAIARMVQLDPGVVDLVLEQARDRGWVRKPAHGLWQLTALGSTVVSDDAAQDGLEVRLLALQDPGSGELLGLCDREFVFEGSLEEGLTVGGVRKPLVAAGAWPADPPNPPTPTQIVSTKPESILSHAAADGIAQAQVLTTATEPRKTRVVVGVIAADAERTVIVPPFDSRKRSAPASPALQRWLAQIPADIRASLPGIEVDQRIENCVADSQQAKLGPEILAASRSLGDSSKGIGSWGALVDSLRALMQGSFLEALRQVRSDGGGISLADRLRASATRYEVTGVIRSTAAAWGVPVDEMDDLFTPAVLLAGLEGRSPLMVAAVLPYAPDQEIRDFWTARPEAFRTAVESARRFDRHAKRPAEDLGPLLGEVARFCRGLASAVGAYVAERPPEINPRVSQADVDTGGTDVEVKPEEVEPPAAEQPGPQLLGATLTASS